MGLPVSILAALTVIGTPTLYFIWKKWYQDGSPPDASRSKSVTYNPQNWHLEIDCSPQALKEDTNSKWSQPISKLPVSIDLPRLARKMSIYNEDHKLMLDGSWPEPFPSIDQNTHIPTDQDNFTTIEGSSEKFPSTQKLLREIMLHLAYQLKEKEAIEAVSEHINEFIPEDYTGDISTMLQNFFVKKLSDSQVLRILKACNQSILAAAVVRLKAAISTKLPYKDYRGAWHIEISFSDDEICVIHKKREMSWEQPQHSPKEDQFEFAWEFLLGFDSKIQTLQRAELSITEIIFHERTSDKRKEEVINIMGSYYCPRNLNQTALSTTTPKTENEKES